MKRSAVTEKAAVLRLAQIIVQRQSGILSDAEALTAPEAFEPWFPARHYGQGQKIRAGADAPEPLQLYEVLTDLDSTEGQAPWNDGMLAVYRPIVQGHAGTVQDQIPFVYGMDARNGLVYSYEGDSYLCKGDMIPCVWYPGTAGLWQWELLGGDTE
jgi:hypothetical protein